MYKKLIITAAFVLLTAAGCFLAFAHKPAPALKQTGSKKCGDAKKSAPSTGFFIVDSFSGIL